MAADFLHCLTFDRFQKVYSEQELFQKAVEGENNQTFLAGWVFFSAQSGTIKIFQKYTIDELIDAVKD